MKTSNINKEKMDWLKKRKKTIEDSINDRKEGIAILADELRIVCGLIEDVKGRFENAEICQPDTDREAVKEVLDPAMRKRYLMHQKAAVNRNEIMYKQKERDGT